MGAFSQYALCPIKPNRYPWSIPKPAITGLLESISETTAQNHGHQLASKFRMPNSQLAFVPRWIRAHSVTNMKMIDGERKCMCMLSSSESVFSNTKIGTV